MKKLILLVVTTIVITSCMSYLDKAEGEETLPLTASASSKNRGNSSSKAVDGDVTTYWAGNSGDTLWWIKFDAGSVDFIEYINVKWVSTDTAPLDYDIEISNDNVNWNIPTGLQGIPGLYSPGGEIRDINQDARYVRLTINSVAASYPAIREFDAFATVVPPPPPVEIPHLVRFQGTLGDAYETPLDGTFNLTFSIYDVEAGGVPLWQELQQSVVVQDGILDVELGSVTPLDLPFDKQYWLGVKVETDEEMTPRFKLTTVPYAFTIEQ